MIQDKKSKIHNWKLFLKIVILVSLVLLNSGLAKPLHAQGSVTPDQIEVTLEPGNCSNETITVLTSPAPIPKLDVALAIDVTHSMEGVIDEVRGSAGKIVADTRALVPDTAFALGTLVDYPNLPGFDNSDSYPWELDQDITQDETKIQKGLNEIVLTWGGDEPESYLRALYETQFISWRDGSRRIVILFGDSFPRAPDPGRDAELGTDDDLTQEKVLEQLVENEISVLTIYINSDNRDFYQRVAERTGGDYFELDDTKDIPDIIEALLSESVRRIRALRLDPSSPFESWLTWAPEVQRDVEPEETRHFALTLCVPPETTPGDYTFDVTVTADGADIGQVPVIVHVVGADLAVSQEGSPNPVLVEEEVSYILTVTNHGSLPATEVMLTDELPQGAEFVSATSTQGNCAEAGGNLTCELFALPNGASATVTIVVKPTLAETMVNSATVAAKEADPDLNNNSSKANLIVNPVSDITITHAPVNEVTEEEVLTYTLTIANNGPSPASDVIFNDMLPAKTAFNSATASEGTCSESGGTVTCQLGEMAENSKASVELVIVPQEHGTITNQATVEANEFDPELSNNEAEVSSLVNRKIPWWLLVPLLLIPLLIAVVRRSRSTTKGTTTTGNTSPTSTSRPDRRIRGGETRGKSSQERPDNPTGAEITHGQARARSQDKASRREKPQSKDKSGKPRLR